jgi:hypothetical protein
VAEDDRAVRERMAALEAEVKAEADAARARKEAALQKLRAQAAENDELKRRQAELLTKKKRDPEPDADDADRSDDIGGALQLAGRANKVRQELQRKPTKGEKSWIKSGIASMALGPIGWLYAGSWREAVPASAVWVVLLSILSKIGLTLLLLPAFMIALPLSGIAGVVYALQYNRHGSRQRLFDRDEDDKPKQLKSG